MGTLCSPSLGIDSRATAALGRDGPAVLETPGSSSGCPGGATPPDAAVVGNCPARDPKTPRPPMAATISASPTTNSAAAITFRRIAALILLRTHRPVGMGGAEGSRGRLEVMANLRQRRGCHWAKRK